MKVAKTLFINRNTTKKSKDSDSMTEKQTIFKNTVLGHLRKLIPQDSPKNIIENGCIIDTLTLKS